MTVVGQIEIFYAPNFEEVEGAYCFWGVRLSVRPSVRHVHATVLKFHIWIPHEKNS